MIFTPEHIQKIVNGTKIETRRVAKTGETHNGLWYDMVMSPGGRIKWQTGRDYAVQPGRGKPCYIHNGMPLRIKILSIHREPLQAISRTDVIAEGISGAGGVGDYRNLWDSINKQPGTRWDDNPYVWVIKFEVLK